MYYHMVNKSAAASTSVTKQYEGGHIVYHEDQDFIVRTIIHVLGATTQAEASVRALTFLVSILQEGTQKGLTFTDHTPDFASEKKEGEYLLRVPSRVRVPHGYGDKVAEDIYVY